MIHLMELGGQVKYAHPHIRGVLRIQIKILIPFLRATILGILISQSTLTHDQEKMRLQLVCI